MRAFTYTHQAPRVVFGAGSIAHLTREMDALGVKKALVLSTPEQQGQAQRIADQIGARCAGVYAKAVMHVPIEVAKDAIALAQVAQADCAIAIGGGSTIGLGKAIALNSAMPIIAIPTTYSGSEMTPIFGMTEAGIKTTGRDAKVLPRTVIYDPELTSTLPVALSVTSGINAIAHAAEGLYAQDGNPIMDLLAVEGISAIARALPALLADSVDLQGRQDALYGSWLCGTVLGNVGMSLHHKLCHTLGGSFNLPHAGVHTVILPHALAFNAGAATNAMAAIAQAVNAESAPMGLWQLARRCGAPTALRDIGMHEADLDQAADLAVQKPYWNPRPVGVEQRSEIRELLQRAWSGQAPQ